MRAFSNTARAALLLAAVIFLLTGASAWAAQGPKLKLNVSMTKEVKTVKDGKEVVSTVTADKVGTGDTIVYTIKYTNEGTGLAKEANIVDPVPAGTVYVLGSAAGADTDITLSIDGGKTYHKEPIMVKVKDKSGEAVEKPASAEAYTNVRWVTTKDILPGKSGHASFKVKVK